MLAVTEKGKIVLVRQYRKPLEKEILELPAGKLEPGENPQNALCGSWRKRLDTGRQALRHLVSFYTSPGFADELLHLYEAQGVSEGTFQPDEDEFVERVELTLEEAFERMESGETVMRRP